LAKEPPSGLSPVSSPSAICPKLDPKLEKSLTRQQVNRFWSYFMPLIGGYMADTRWGKLMTIQVSIGLAMFGHIIMIIAALPQVIKNPDGALGCLAVGIIFFGAGVGGFK
jgi:dipeptide/tripeptide permease